MAHRSYQLTDKAHAALAARCSVTQVADRDWWCVTHGRDADVCERETGQSDDTDPALPPFEPQRSGVSGERAQLSTGSDDATEGDAMIHPGAVIFLRACKYCLNYGPDDALWACPDCEIDLSWRVEAVVRHVR